ncbi:flagellar assembly protein FliX [Sphingomonas mucosissima]|nr:flagellar assembly protein FliX [Sphingomonas mucosissima]
MMPTAPEQPAPAATPHHQSAVVPTTSVQMLVQLAAADPSVERRRKMAENAGRGLALLDRFDVETRVRPAAVEPLDALRDWLETFEMPDDPELAAVMQEIELRVKVELAKHELRV